MGSLRVAHVTYVEAWSKAFQMALRQSLLLPGPYGLVVVVVNLTK